MMSSTIMFSFLADDPASRSWPSHHLCYRSTFLLVCGCFSDKTSSFPRWRWQADVSCEASKHTGNLEGVSGINGGHTLPAIVLVLTLLIKSYLAANIAWAAANTSIKISIVHFYITVFRSNKAFLKVAYAVIAAVISFGVGIVLCTFLICRPIAKFWYSTLPGNCGNFVQFLLALSICNVAIDLTIILLPIPMIWWLQTSKRRKMELTITFTLGLVYVPQTYDSVQIVADH